MSQHRDGKNALRFFLGNPLISMVVQTAEAEGLKIDLDRLEQVLAELPERPTLPLLLASLQRLLDAHLDETIQKYTTARANFKQGTDTHWVLELPKLEIADQLLRQLGIEVR
jgi:hypothetical protein